LQFSNPGKASGFDYWYETISESIDDGGNDLVYSSVSWSLGKNLESLVLTGMTAINGTGNNENNTITGNTAANTLDGMGGTDTLNGGAGNDEINGYPVSSGFYSYWSSAGSKIVYGEDGNDFIYGI
jgi:Ca2+-binding RTX toxin-like protein